MTYPTSYGNEILEISLSGDTLFQLKKGEKGLDKIIHHEILQDKNGHFVTLTQEKREIDLSSKGGTTKDTVCGDGILVLDKEGNKVWSWSVFDVLNPVSDPEILKNKSDWLHANSLSITQDENYLISFYQGRQIWKVNAKTGKIMWKLGKEGNISLSSSGLFSESHAVHFMDSAHLLLFENGVNVKQSRIRSYNLEEENFKAVPALSLAVPEGLYSERMGSAYSIDKNCFLVCSSQAMFLTVMNEEGKILWKVRTAFIPYRAEFIDALPFSN